MERKHGVLGTAITAFTVEQQHDFLGHYIANMPGMGRLDVYQA